MPRFILVTRDWTGLGLGILAKSQGSDVVAAYSYDEKKQSEELDHLELLGDGFFEKIPLNQAITKFLRDGDVWVFDNNELPRDAEKLRRAGELVIGTSILSAKMEHDRDYAAGVAESLGLKLPETKKFTDYNSALGFLQAHKDKSYVYKPFEGDATSTYVPQERENLSKANEELREYISTLSGEEHPKFLLQEVVEGTEAAFDLWVRNGKPVASFLDLESKRKLTGDLGENIGCAGGYVTKIPFNSRGIQETVAKYLNWDELKEYTGSIDVNVIFTEKGPLFLENCFRFGYAAYPAMFHSLAQESLEDTLREWVTGKGKMEDWFEPGFAGSLTLTSDNAKDGSPILIPSEIRDKVHIYRAFLEKGDKIRLVEGWPEIAVVTAPARTIENAGSKCLALAEAVSFPDKGYRVDLAQADLPTLPLARFRSLQASGYLR